MTGRAPHPLAKLSPRQLSWLNSVEFHAIRIAALRVATAKIRAAPKCGAHARSTGQPCRKIALDNGRCVIHGGKSPKGDQWHKPQLANASKSDRKLRRKIADLERRQARRAERIASMTDDARQKYERMRALSKPGSAAARAGAKARRRQNIEMQELIAAQLAADETRQRENPQIEELRREAARLEGMLLFG